MSSPNLKSFYTLFKPFRLDIMTTNVNEFRYQEFGYFLMILDDGDIGKWRALVRSLEVPDQFSLSFLLNGLARDNITFECVRLMLEQHRPYDREGAMT